MYLSPCGIGGEETPYGAKVNAVRHLVLLERLCLWSIRTINSSANDWRQGAFQPLESIYRIDFMGEWAFWGHRIIVHYCTFGQGSVHPLCLRTSLGPYIDLESMLGGPCRLYLRRYLGISHAAWKVSRISTQLTKSPWWKVENMWAYVLISQILPVSLPQNLYNSQYCHIGLCNPTVLSLKRSNYQLVECGHGSLAR